MQNRSRGFTLVEVMVTIAVLAILATIAIPNYQRFVAESRMSAQANDLLTALHLARSEAVKRNAQVSVSAIGGNWANGWQVVANDEVLREFAALKAGSTLDGGGITTVTFQSNGTFKFNGQAGVVKFELRPANSSLSPGRNISVDLAGRPSVCKPGYCS